MGELKVKDKDIVVPGEILATGMDHLPTGAAFREDDALVASQVGIVTIEGRLVKVVPLNTIYIPKRGDLLIGKVVEVGMNGWFVDIGGVNDGVISLREGSDDFIRKGADLSQYYTYGDHVVVTVYGVNKGKQPDLSMKGPGLKKLNGGRILRINAAKIPRVIGKQGSMVSMIKQYTDCRIMAGQNGFVWVSGVDPEKEIMAVEAIKMIETKAHHSGLTDEVQKFLESKVRK